MCPHHLFGLVTKYFLAGGRNIGEISISISCKYLVEASLSDIPEFLLRYPSCFLYLLSFGDVGGYLCHANYFVALFDPAQASGIS